MNRLLAISLAALVSVQALLGGGGGGGVLCLGGGHHHSEAESTHCDSACGHESAWPLPVPSEDQHDDCGCTDIEFVATDLAAFPKGDGGAEATPDVIAWADPGIVFFGARTDGCGGLRSPPRFDPGGARRLASIASVRLIL